MRYPLSDVYTVYIYLALCLCNNLDSLNLYGQNVHHKRYMYKLKCFSVSFNQLYSTCKKKNPPVVGCLHVSQTVSNLAVLGQKNK